jgi:putative tryptophan/tyrosine transport system substrate-binding protein
MNRREFITLVAGGAVAWPFSAQGQTSALVGYLTVSSQAGGERVAAAFRRGLSEAGFIEGRNVIVQYRYADGEIDKLRASAEDFVRRGVSVIAAMGGSRAALVAKATTGTIPIVFTMGDADPVKVGVVASLARPGGNTTGISLLGGVLGAKRLELLRELVPSAATIGVLINPHNRDVAAEREELDNAIAKDGQKAVIVEAGPSDDIEGAIAKFVRNQVDGIVVTADPIFTNRRAQITALVARYRIPAIYQWNLFVAAGGLISYGTDLEDIYRQAGHYTARVLKGERPGDLPVLQPTKFLLSLNLSAAKALGLAVPPMLLARADEVIE